VVNCFVFIERTVYTVAKSGFKKHEFLKEYTMKDKKVTIVGDAGLIYDYFIIKNYQAQTIIKSYSTL
jgi:hypothetical protein